MRLRKAKKKTHTKLDFKENFCAAIRDDELTALEAIEFIVDYNLIIERDGEDFEQDECYELIHNTSVAIDKK